MISGHTFTRWRLPSYPRLTITIRSSSKDKPIQTLKSDLSVNWILITVIWVLYYCSIIRRWVDTESCRQKWFWQKWTVLLINKWFLNSNRWLVILLPNGNKIMKPSVARKTLLIKLLHWIYIQLEFSDIFKAVNHSNNSLWIDYSNYYNLIKFVMIWSFGHLCPFFGILVRNCSSKSIV